MRHRIIILEGPDNCGKSTLGKSIAKQYRGIYWRMTAGPGLWEPDAMFLYMSNALDNAEDNLSIGAGLIVIDRHWISEHIYGAILRGRSTEITKEQQKLIDRLNDLGTLYIYCTRDNAVEEHEKAQDPDHPYRNSDFRKICIAYDNFFREFEISNKVIPYRLNYFLNKPDLRQAYIDGLRLA